ncbi:protein kinase domain-containing protein [Nocardia seriolae]|uniref:Serine/threonine protein kinase n=1 Tax=Nocardia seriolae TaxID=37332 RepID=A0ABC9YTL7_9NOCA|nr:protein kinase [Nocardia seriolae]BEK99525.1 serine/threonine-protein kinase [Nocardia seriolae]GAM46940.1 serine/threonine protein kinase [Nocardia seriolae]GAP28844.1 serine/threonine protein kinase [Nocardia seriolae]
MNGLPAQAVARFAADWESTLRGERGEPPSLAGYLPDGAAVRLAVLTDLVRVDMRQRWRRAGLEKRITEYRSEFPEVGASPGFADLVCDEYVARSRLRPLDVDSFTAEYPEVAGEIRRRFTGETPPPAPPVLPDGIEIGRRLDDFELLTDLGGAEGSRMFLARQRSMQRLVAVRVEAGADSDTETVAQLDHQYIVRVFDQRLIADGSTGKPLRLLYMQYLPGGTIEGVRERLRAETGTVADGGLLLRAIDAAMESKGEPRPSGSRVRAEIAGLTWPETVAWVGRRLAEAIEYGDRHGVLHHDIRPSNVLFTAEGVPKLADFSLGQGYWGPGGARGAAAGGTEALRYKSPEALAALLDAAAPTPDTRGDIYSLGLVLWEMLTGTLPFEEDDDAGVEDDGGTDMVTAMLARRIAGVPAAALATLPADTPATLRRVLLECLRPEPSRRWRSGAQLAGQLDLSLDARARDLVDPPPHSVWARLRRWPVPIAVLCVGLPNALASWYNIRINQSLIVDELSAGDQHRFEQVALLNNAITFPLAAALLLWLARRPLTVSYRLARGQEYGPARLARARADTLLMGERAVWIPFAMWMIAGIAWPLALQRAGANLPHHAFWHFFAAQVVCALIALAYPYFGIMVYTLRSLYPQLLARGSVGANDRRQLAALARRSNLYLAAAASVPLLGVATMTFVSTADLWLVIVPLRWLSVGGVLAFVLTYWLSRLLESDLRALVRAIPEGGR